MIKNVSFLIGELLFVPFDEKLVLTYIPGITEKLDDVEIYSIDLHNTSSLTKSPSSVFL